MNRLARLLGFVWDAVVDDCDWDDYAPVIVCLVVAALFGLAIGLADQ